MKRFSVVFLVVFFATLHGEEAKTQRLKELNAPCTGNFFLQTDLLYWKARQEGSDVLSSTSKFNGGTTVDTAAVTAEAFETKRTYYRLHFDGRCGFRVGAGYQFKECTWALSSFWTHLNGHGNVGPSSIRGHWNLNYNVLDILTTGPQFCLGSSFKWKAFGGIRAALIDQKLHALAKSSGTTTNPFSDQNRTLSTTNIDFKIRSHFRGIGPEVGVNAGWNLRKRFTVYANAGGSLLYSHYDAKFSDSLQDTTTHLSVTDPTTTSLYSSDENTKASTNTCQIVLDLGLGIGWQRYACLCSRKINYVLKLGWEHSQWFNHNAVGRKGDLCFDGLTLSAQFQF